MTFDSIITFPGCPEVLARVTSGDAVMQTGNMCARLPLNPLNCLLHAMYRVRQPFWNSRERSITQEQMERFRFVRDVLARHFSHVPTGGYSEHRHYQPRFVSVGQLVRLARDIAPIAEQLFTRQEQPKLFRALDNTGLTLSRWLAVWEGALTAYTATKGGEERPVDRVDPEELLRDIVKATTGETLPRPAAVQTQETVFRDAPAADDTFMPPDRATLPMLVEKSPRTGPVLERVDAYLLRFPVGTPYSRVSDVASALFALFPGIMTDVYLAAGQSPDDTSTQHVMYLNFNRLESPEAIETAHRRVLEVLSSIEEFE